MPVTRIVTEIDSNDTRAINFAKNLIIADGGKARVVPEADGTVSVVGVFPTDAPDLVLPQQGTSAASWMEFARKELGQKEVPEDGDNPRIREYHDAAGGDEPDSVPWCSSFVNWCMMQAGVERTKSKAARSWANWGKEVPDFLPGCVVVLSRGADPAKGHVGFYVGEDNGLIQLLGGNQNDSVSIASYDRDRLVAKRMPSA